VAAAGVAAAAARLRLLLLLLWILRLLLKQVAMDTSGTRHPWDRTLRLLWLRDLLHLQLIGGGLAASVSSSKAKLSIVAAFH